MLKIELYVPTEHCETVKQAMFGAGAGRIETNGRYDHCAWQTKGMGQFRPLAGSQPAIGELMIDECVEEYKVEMLLQHSCLSDVVVAMKQAHPYEQPAYSVTEVIDV